MHIDSYMYRNWQKLYKKGEQFLLTPGSRHYLPVLKKVFKLDKTE